jgi:hypothetical protein
VALERPWRRGAKVFWFFFSKKNSLFLLTFLIFVRLGNYQKSSKKTFIFLGLFQCFITEVFGARFGLAA